ncbi:MAG: pectinesterase family protein [Paludibacter sp.]|nr:pectinesterase family protein [Paludibacter sp.]
MKSLKSLFLFFLLALFVTAGLSAQTEQLLIDENFQSWTGFTATTANPGLVVNKATMISNESLVYTMHGVSVVPSGYASGSSTNILSSAGCLKMQKNTEVLTEGIAMSIELSPLKSITKVWIVECTTGSNRGFQVWKKSAGDVDWVSIHNAVCNPSSGMAVNLNINEENVTLKFTNLAPGQYAFLSDIKIWGNVTDVAIPPVIQSITPANNSIIPVSGAITIVFSENVNRGSGAIRMGDVVISESDISINNETATIQYSGLKTDSSYEFVIPAGAFINGENTPTASETRMNYKTPDTILPTLTKLSVAEDAVMPVNGFISLIMSEACQAGTESVYIGTKSITAAVSASNNNLMYLNYSGLTYDTEYVVDISSGAITDLSGNPYAGISFSFRTEVDAKGDLLLGFIPDVSTMPASSSGTVTQIINGYTIEFGGVASAGARNAGTYTYAFKCNYVQLPELPSVGELSFYIQSGGGTVPQEYYLQKLSADGTNWNTIETFILGNNDRNTIRCAAAQSSVPVTLRLIYNSSQFWFYDLQVFTYADNGPVDDGQIPTILSTNPADSSTDVGINGNIKLVFSENVRLHTGSITLDGKTLTPGIVGKHITLPYSNLKYATHYTMKIPAGAFQDFFNNDCEAFTLNFITRAKPVVTPKLFDFVVAADGSGNGTTIQSAFDAVPLNNAVTYLIFVKDGVYNEYPTLAQTKNQVSLIGQSRNGVIVTGNRRSGVDGYTTSTCQTMEIRGNDFYCENMTFQNTAGVSAGQAVALKVYADKAVFKNVRLDGYQDTHLTSNVGGDRQYYLNCEIRGSVDFIFGNGVCYFDHCLIYVQDRTTANVIVAPSTSTSNTYGYVFSNCTIDGAASQDGNYNLGRPWQNAPRAVYLNTKMNILPSAGAWGSMSTIPALFAEYGSVNASNYPVDLSARNTLFSYTNANNQVITGSSPTAVLTENEAAGYTIANVLGGSDSWDATVKAETTSTPENLIVNLGVLSWTSVDGSICYIVLRNGIVHTYTTETSILVNEQDIYSVIAVSNYGALSVAASKDLTATSTIESFLPALTSNLVVDKLEFNHPDQIKKVRIINLNGHSFFADIAGRSNIDIANLKPGFYMVQITSLENRTATYKFLKQ